MSNELGYPKSAVVFGRRWRDSSGNTYHTAQVWVDGDYVGKTRKTYGYGESYLESALRLMEEMKVLPSRERYDDGRLMDARFYCSEHYINLIYSASNVAREKDL